jgi:hypothetical protein
MAALEPLSSTGWVRNYRSSKGLGYPMVFDSTGRVSSLYRSGIAHGNNPPTYILIDKKGIVRFRSDGVFNKVLQISDSITVLLGEH